jgi:hypothetical protein
MVNTAEWIAFRAGHQSLGANHPHTHGKIGLWHQTLRNRVLL